MPRKNKPRQHRGKNKKHAKAVAYAYIGISKSTATNAHLQPHSNTGGEKTKKYRISTTARNAIIASGVSYEAALAWANMPDNPSTCMTRTLFLNQCPASAPLMLGELDFLPDPDIATKALDTHGFRAAYETIRNLLPEDTRPNRKTLLKLLKGTALVQGKSLVSLLKQHRLEIALKYYSDILDVPGNISFISVVDAPILHSLLPIFATVAQSMKGSEAYFDNVPLSPVIPVMRGLYDSRALVSQGLPDTYIPDTPFASHVYKCLMDVFGFFMPEKNTLPGVYQNITAFQKAVMRTQAIAGYEYSLVRILFWALQQHLPQHLQEPYKTFEQENPQCPPDDVWHTLHRKEAYAMIVTDRLVKNASLLAAAIECNDRHAFAHILSRCVRDNVTPEETLHILHLTFNENKDSFLSLKSLFEDAAATSGIAKKINDAFQATASAKHSITLRPAQKEDTGIQIIEPISSAFAKDIETEAKYHVAPTTRKKDQIFRAEKLIDLETAKTLSAGLYRVFGREILNADATGKRLASLLRIPETDDWVSGLEDGPLLDPSALTRLITDPTSLTIHRDRKKTSLLSYNTAVTILIDGSGSMLSNNKIQLAIIAAERLTKWLSVCGIPVELLGFTTQGIPDDDKTEGRADKLKFYVFKKWNEPYKEQSTLNALCAMLYTGNMGGTVLGESIVWAHDNSVKQPFKRRLLFVVTDGQPAFLYREPMTTDYHNTAPQRHYATAVQWIEKHSPVDLIGIGIQDNLSNVFTKALRIDDANNLMEAFVLPLIQLIDPLTAAHRRAQKKPSLSGIQWPKEKRPKITP